MTMDQRVPVKIAPELNKKLMLVAVLHGKTKQQLIHELLEQSLDPLWRKVKKLRFRS